jgi:WD40 repeat protein
MRSLAILIAVIWSVAAWADDAKPIADGAAVWRLQISTADKTYLVRPDGSERREVERAGTARAGGDAPGELSPDGKRRVVVGLENAIWVAKVEDAVGTNEKKLTESSASQICASWSPDSKHVAYASAESGTPQIYVAEADGSNAKQITQEAIGAYQCHYGPGGQLAYLAWRGKPKLRPADLIVVDDKGSRAIVKNTFIGEFAFSPDGKTIAYSKLGSLVFHDLASGKEREIEFKKIDPRLDSHTAWKMTWRPDGGAMACAIMFLGGRLAGTQIFGDDEIFVLPREGEPTWFTPAEKAERVEWVIAGQ